MIPLPSNYQDPHGFEFDSDAVVVVQNANSSCSENRSIILNENRQYVEQSSNTYSRIDFTARIYVSEQAFEDGMKGIPFYTPEGLDYVFVENADLTGDLVAQCYQHIETLYA